MYTSVYLIIGLSPQKLTANFALNKDGVQQNNNGANVAVSISFDNFLGVK